MRPISEQTIQVMQEMRSRNVPIRIISKKLRVGKSAIMRYTARLEVQRCTGCDEPGHKRNRCPKGPWPEVGNAQSSAYARRHKALGLCTSCPRPVQPGYLECEVCRKNATVG